MTGIEQGGGNAPLPFKAKWVNAPDMAEVAETLGVQANAIMAASNPDTDTSVVLYSPDVEHDPERIFAAVLRRDRDGIFQLAGVPREQVGMWDTLKARLDEELG